VTIRISTQLTKKDYIKIKTRAILNPNRWKYRILFLVAVSLFAYFIFSLSPLFTFVAIFAWLAMIVSLFTSLLVIPNQANYKENANLFLPTEYEFNNDGFSVINSISRAEYKWLGIIKWRAVKDYYVIVADNTSYIIKAQDIVDKGTFDRLLNEKVKDKLS
jgi:hypothetical protein